MSKKHLASLYPLSCILISYRNSYIHVLHFTEKSEFNVFQAQARKDATI